MPFVRWTRVALPVALCSAFALAPAASAAARPCITDRAGDYNAELTPTGDPTADLLSVDVASAGGRLTATVKLAALDVASPVLGHRYDVYLSNGERTVSLDAIVDNGRGSFALVELTGDTDEGATTGTVLGSITGRLDAHRRSIVLTVELARLGFGTGQLVRVSARSWRSVGTMNTAPDPGRAATYGQMDDSDDAAAYRLGRRGCAR